VTEDIVTILRTGFGQDCKCYAHCYCECGCSGVEWAEKYTDEAADEIERLRNALKDERELRLNAETRAMARIADIDIRDAHIRYLKSAITNKEEQQ